MSWLWTSPYWSSFTNRTDLVHTLRQVIRYRQAGCVCETGATGTALAQKLSIPGITLSPFRGPTIIASITILSLSLSLSVHTQIITVYKGKVVSVLNQAPRHEDVLG
jgi:hypothetical protein